MNALDRFGHRQRVVFIFKQRQRLGHTLAGDLSMFRGSDAFPISILSIQTGYLQETRWHFRDQEPIVNLELDYSLVSHMPQNGSIGLFPLNLDLPINLSTNASSTTSVEQ